MPEMTTSNANASQQLYNDDFLIELRQQMMKFAVLQLSSFHQAEDVVQEALVSALQYSGSFSGRSAFKTWVFAILKNKIVDLIRQKQRLVSMSELFDTEENERSVDELFDASGHWQKFLDDFRYLFESFTSKVCTSVYVAGNDRT